MAEKRRPKQKEKTENAASDEKACCSHRGGNYSLIRNTLKWDKLPTENRFIGKRQLGVDKPIDLEQSMQKKTLGLVSKENTLASVCNEAAEEARRKEEKFKEKSALLAQQIRKDEDLIKMLKRC